MNKSIDQIRGAEEITVSARSEFTTAYLVEKGTLMRWSFRVQGYDIGFGVRVRIMQDGGSREEDVLAVERYDNVDTIEGSWVADEDSTLHMIERFLFVFLFMLPLAFLAFSLRLLRCSCCAKIDSIMFISTIGLLG